ncbi:ATP-binding cassette domain-containing protein [Jonesia denitrificans]|uniref:ABC transporter ATP-binding protein n=1 Tax=Jonesia denitrificans TaxID=43674 RepID=UPI0018D4DE32|nr:ATP-binding cassette domain-containing protein [Jonesia denitrificans]QXB42543.1 ATP-binding cassette domain-containing protein [Jonesia denitrificans]
MLRVSELVCGYKKPLFDPISFSLEPGESIAITGKSGTGKTTVLNTVLGFMSPISGSVVIDGREIGGLPYQQLARLRSSVVGTVFQHGELLSEYSATDNVALARLLMKKRDSAAYETARKLVDSFQVEPTRMARDLSGGERQRVALARALINQPKLILADEPTGSLDPESRDDIVGRLIDVSRTHGTSLVIVTHDPVVAAIADKQLRLVPAVPQAGEIAGVGRLASGALK